MDRVRAAGLRVATASDFGMLGSLFLRNTPSITGIDWVERGPEVSPPARLAILALGCPIVIAAAVIARRRGAIALAPAALTGAPGFAVVLLAIVVITRGRMSPSYVPSLPRTELASPSRSRSSSGPAGGSFGARTIGSPRRTASRSSAWRSRSRSSASCARGSRRRSSTCHRRSGWSPSRRWTSPLPRVRSATPRCSGSRRCA